MTPGARQERVGGTHGDALRVSVQAPPVDGKANAACVAALAVAFSVPRHAVEIAPDARGRRKLVRIAGDGADLARRFETLATGR